MTQQGSEGEHILRDLVAIAEAARKKDSDDMHDRLSALLQRGGMASDVMAAMLMKKRSRDCFLATSSLALDEDNFEAIFDVLEEVLEDADAVQFIQTVFEKHGRQAPFQDVLRILKEHEASMPAPDSQLGYQRDDGTVAEEDEHSMSTGFVSGCAAAASEPESDFAEGDPPSGVQSLREDEVVIVPVHTCLGPCRWHNKPGGCRMSENECKFCHICPKEKRPNKITRECQRLGLSKKQLQEKMRLESLDAYSGGIQHTWQPGRQESTSLEGYQQFPPWPSGVDIQNLQ